MEGTITTPPPIPARPAKKPATTPIPNAMNTWVRSPKATASGSGLAPLIMRSATTNSTTPKTIVRVRELLRCMIDAPMTEPTTPPIPTVTPIPRATSPDIPKEAAPAAAMKTMAARDVAWDRC